MCAAKLDGISGVSRSTGIFEPEDPNQVLQFITAIQQGRPVIFDGLVHDGTQDVNRSLQVMLTRVEIVRDESRVYFDEVEKFAP